MGLAASRVASPRWRSTIAASDVRSGEGCGAGDRGRTDDIQIGNLALYQLSYARKTVLAMWTMTLFRFALNVRFLSFRDSRHA